MKLIALVVLIVLTAACDSNSGTSMTPEIDSPPELSVIADQNGTVNALVGPVAIDVTDDRTPEANLVVSAVAADQSLIAGLTVAGTGGARTLVITPRENQSGSSSVSITVTDANGLQATRSFVVTFDFVDTPFDLLARDIFAQPATAEPVELNAFRVSATQSSFDDLVVSGGAGQ